MTDHLARAKDYIAKGEDYYRKAAEEIVAAIEKDPTLSHREIGEQLGKHHTWVGRLVQAYTSGAHAHHEPLAVDWHSGSNKRDEVARKVLANPVQRREVIQSLDAAGVESIIEEANDVAIERLRSRKAEQDTTEGKPTVRDLTGGDRFDPAEHWADTLIIRVNRNARELQSKIKGAGGLLYGSMSPDEAFQYLHEAEGMIAEARAAAQEQVQDAGVKV